MNKRGLSPIFFKKYETIMVWDFNVGRDYRGILTWDRIIVGLSVADKIKQVGNR